MAGLMGMNQYLAGQSIRGYGDLSTMEQNRNATNKRLKAQHQQAQTSATLSGAASGAMIGTEILPGWGTAIGAVAGAAFGYLSSDAF